MSVKRAEAVPPPQQQLHSLEKARGTVDQILRDLPDESLWTTERILTLYWHTEAIGRQLWRVQCASVAELLSRAERLPGGRGQRDVEGTGKKAAAREIARQLTEVAAKRAELIGEEPRSISKQTVEQDARIYETFLRGETSRDVTTSLDKSFFVIALTTDAPSESLQLFAAEKERNPEFSIRDARRMVRQSRRQAPALAESSVAVYAETEREAVRDFIEKAVRLIRQLADNCPSRAITMKMNGWAVWLVQQKERTPEKDWERISFSMTEGATTIAEIAEDTGMEDFEVRERLQPRIDSGQVRVGKQEGKPDAARGARTTLYFLK